MVYYFTLVALWAILNKSMIYLINRTIENIRKRLLLVVLRWYQLAGHVTVIEGRDGRSERSQIK
jgi:hypothetical protein